MLLLPVELQDALEVGVHRLAEIELRLPDLVFFALSANKIRGDPRLDNRPALSLDGLLGRSSPEATPEAVGMRPLVLASPRAAFESTSLGSSY